MHFQCWSFCHRSQKYGHVPRTRHHSVSCGQLSAFTSGIKQCIFRRYLSVSFRRTYYGHILSAESDDKSDNNSIMPPLLSIEKTNALNSRDESDHEPISKNILDNVSERSQSHPNVNRGESRYKIRDRIEKRQP